METILPFRHVHEITILKKIHPLTRLILPFILVLPFLFLDDIYLIIISILFTFFFSIFTRLNLHRIFRRVLRVLPLIILITIFLPLYIGSNPLYQISLGTLLTLNIYQEGLSIAILLFLRIFGAIYIFMSLFSSLTYSEFIEALTKIRLIPPFFIGSLVIMLHYIPILADSNKKILEAQELRGKKITTYREKIKTHAFIMGKSIVMNMERSERLYESLKMRGFSGEITFAKKSFKICDGALLGAFLIFIFLFIYLIDLELIYKEVSNLFLL